jgi:hypothetical protein
MGRGTAILGVCDAANSTTTQGVDNPHGRLEATPGYMWFRKGMTVSFWNTGSSAYIPTTATVGYGIASITPGSNQFVLSTSPAAATADGDYIVRTNSASFDTSDITTIDAHATGNGVIMGIDRIIDDDQNTVTAYGDDLDSFQGIDGSASAQNWWRAKVQGTTASGRGILTETKLQEDLDAIEQNTDGDAPNLALTTYALRNKLIEIVKSDRMISTLNLVGGWEAIKYRGGSVSLPIMVHKFNPTGYIYYINLKYLKFYTLKKLVWDSSGGGVIKPVSGEDQYEAWCPTGKPSYKHFLNSGKATADWYANPELSPLWESVETRQEASFWDEGIVQTTNTIYSGDESRS